MKKLLVSMFSCLLLCGTLNAQSYYSSTKTIQGNGFAFKCENKFGSHALLYNATNIFADGIQVNVDGSRIEYKVNQPQFADPNNTNQKQARLILYNAFSASERLKLKDKKILIKLIINPKTGKLWEVVFTFNSETFWGSIPIQTFYNIENRLKEVICYVPSENAKKLNYGVYSFSQDVSIPVID